MSQLSRLIAELSPTGVEHRPLGSVGEFVRGGGLQKSDLQGSGHPAIHYGQIHTVYGVWTTTTKSYVAPDMAARLRRAMQGDVGLATTSEDDAAVGKATAWLGDKEAAVSGDAFIFRHGLDPKFVSYFLASTSFHVQKRPFISGAKVRRLSGTDLGKIVIPVPPLEVQREIVRILDHFTELEAELEARTVQLAQLRSRLLTQGVHPSVKLDEIADFRYGLTASAMPEGDTRFLRITDIDANGKLRPDGAKFVSGAGISDEHRAQPMDILVARTGGTYGKTMLVEHPGPAAYASFLIRLRTDPARMHARFYWHFAQSDLYWRQANALVSTGGQPQFNANVLRQVAVPAPPLDEQLRIVETLDSLDRLVTDLSVGLPAELAARRRQYEYYRDKLLTFEEAT